MIQEKPMSSPAMYRPIMTLKSITTKVEPLSSSQVGQVTFFSSSMDSLTYCWILRIMTPGSEQVGRDSNPQPTVLETVTLPIELPTYSDFLTWFPCEQYACGRTGSTSCTLRERGEDACSYRSHSCADCIRCIRA